MNPHGEERMGRTAGNVMLQLSNGFTKGTSVHTLGPDINTTAELRWQKPYVARYSYIVLFTTLSPCTSLSLTKPHDHKFKQRATCGHDKVLVKALSKAVKFSIFIGSPRAYFSRNSAAARDHVGVASQTDWSPIRSVIICTY